MCDRTLFCMLFALKWIYGQKHRSYLVRTSLYALLGLSKKNWLVCQGWTCIFNGVSPIYFALYTQSINFNDLSHIWLGTGANLLNLVASSSAKWCTPSFDVAWSSKLQFDQNYSTISCIILLRATKLYKEKHTMKCESICISFVALN